jgi:hypothetical protein
VQKLEVAVKATAVIPVIIHTQYVPDGKIFLFIIDLAASCNFDF